jgi:hypothetical protein
MRSKCSYIAAKYIWFKFSTFLQAPLNQEFNIEALVLGRALGILVGVAQDGLEPAGDLLQA